MPQTSGNKPELPEVVRKSLDQFCRCMNEALGDTLLSIVLFGDLVKTGQLDLRSPDANIMVVLSDVNVEVLDCIASCISMTARDLRLSPMVLSEQDLRSSTDVFPIKFMDMQEHHVLLQGTDLLAELSIARDHVRLRCEQEIKNLMLRLRQLYLRRSDYPEAIETTLSAATSPLVSNLQVLIELKTGVKSMGEREVLAEIKGLGLDMQVLERLLALKHDELKLDVDELKNLYDRSMQFVQKAAELVDAL